MSNNISDANISDDDRRKFKRVSVLADFLLFVPDGSETPNFNETPYVSAGLYDISLGGAQFACNSLVAHLPGSSIERRIAKDTQIWLVPDHRDKKKEAKEDNDNEKIDKLGEEPIAAKVMWVKDNRIGCMFINPAEGFTKALEKIIDDILLEANIEL